MSAELLMCCLLGDAERARDRLPGVSRQACAAHLGLLGAGDLPTDAGEPVQLGGDRLALTRADRDAMRTDFWDAYCGVANTELIEYARSLRGRASLAILSNSADGAREEEERRYGFSEIFDPICYSHEQGMNKPEERAYTLALTRMDADAGDVFFIDDHQHAVDGAAAVGIRGIVHVDNASTIAAIEEFLAGR
ncbi:FMN phosphatase YigB (HAD superfamily) [Microbacterium sp. W4I4]|uniref:HAD family hydrolase n=1 Tax=Microbacterium sp. W4I4 TaxID=3042295 RepID=UPI002786CCDD|nr:HAD hydrolase-like protein [Microbacterium sp. W4I4]MDQ0613558.1 FMN phosphatase YigB (HAD superfamily) [Microbacterium sp. W4I4]